MLLVSNQINYLIPEVKPWDTGCSNSITLSDYRVEIKCDKDLLSLEQDKHLTKTVNVSIVYDLNACIRNPSKNFKFKNWLYGANNIVKHSDQEKYVCSSGYEITFDGTGLLGFDNDFNRNVIIVVVDNSSSSHSEDGNNDF